MLMFLSDRSIQKLAVEYNLVQPFNEDHCEGATLNITLDSQVMKQNKTDPVVFGAKEDESDYQVIDLEKETFLLGPQESVLVKSVEYFRIPDDMIGLVLERYSVKLMGLTISPASYMNPGYEGTLSFVMVNNSSRPIQLVPGVKFCQLSVAMLNSPSARPYNKQDARYWGARDVSISKLHLDREIQQFLISKGVENVATETAEHLGKHLMDLMKGSADKIAAEMKKKFGEPK